MTSRTLCACVISVLFLLTCSAFSQSIPTVVLGGFVVSKLLDQFEGTANRLLQNGSTAGDALGTKFGDELRIATRNTELALADQRNKTFDQLSPVEQSLFVSLNQIITTADSLSNKALTMEEIGNIDLIEFTNRLPFTKKVDFYLSSVKGLTQVHTAASYDILLRGLGIGFSPGDRAYTVSVKIADKTLDGTHFRPQSSTDLLIDIPSAEMEHYFADDKITVLPVVLTSTISVHHSFLGYKWDTPTVFTVPFDLALMPRFPAVIAGSELITVPAWDPTPYTKSVTVTVQDCHPDRPCNWNRTVDLANDEFATNVRYACTGQCGWDYNQRHGGYAPDFDILNAGHQVAVYRHNDGEHSTTGTYYVDYQKKTANIASKPISSRRVNFGEAITLDLDPQNAGCNFEVKAAFVTHQNPVLDSTLTQSVDGLLIKKGAGQFGDHCRVSIALNTP